MYYEKLNQGCIAGWRIRQNHLWRFENGGFQGRGMKQEEAMAQQAKENEAMATAVHKAAAAAALAQGHPGIKVSMSSSGLNESANKRRKPNGQARRKNEKKKPEEFDYSTYQATPTYEADSAALQSLEQVGESSTQPAQQQQQTTEEQNLDASQLQQAMAAANAVAGVGSVGQMDELEMGMQLPIEMQMHSESHDDREYYDGNYAQGYGEYNQQQYGDGYQQQ